MVPGFLYSLLFWLSTRPISLLDGHLVSVPKVAVLKESWLWWVQERVKKFLLCFTSFSGHRPAQRECAQTGLRSHARCHPYPIPQPIKVYHTTGVYDPYSFWIVMWVFLHPTRTNQWKCCECWSSWGLNPWPPARQTGSLKIYEAPKLQKASPPIIGFQSRRT